MCDTSTVHPHVFLLCFSTRLDENTSGGNPQWKIPVITVLGSTPKWGIPENTEKYNFSVLVLLLMYVNVYDIV